MKQLQPYWFKPHNQRAGKPEVEFQLKPISQRTFMHMFGDWKGGKPSPDSVLVAVDDAVVGWRGLEQPFSPAARRALFDGEVSLDAASWAYEIAGHAFLRSQLKEDEAKNSESPSTSQ